MTSSSASPKAPSRAWAWVKEIAILIVSALVLSVLIKAFLFQSFWIPSESMETTLDVGDRILVTQWRPGPLDVRRGDIVVFEDPGTWIGGAPVEEAGGVEGAVKDALTFVGLLPEDTGNHLVKRVVGLPGETIECCDDLGRVTVDGVPLDEPYLDAGILPSDREFSTTVPLGYVWVMGDNRPASADSRYHMGDPGGGSIPIDAIVGTSFAIAWPLEHATVFTNPFSGDL